MWKGLSVYPRCRDLRLFQYFNTRKYFDTEIELSIEFILVFDPNSHSTILKWFIEQWINWKTHRNQNESFLRSDTIINKRPNQFMYHNGLYHFYSNWIANLDETNSDCICGGSVGQLKVKQHSGLDSFELLTVCSVRWRQYRADQGWRKGMRILKAGKLDDFASIMICYVNLSSLSWK